MLRSYAPVARRLLDLLSKISDSSIYRHIHNDDRFVEMLQDERSEGYRTSKKEVINEFISSRWDNIASDLLENAKEHDGKLVVHRCITTRDPRSFGETLVDVALTSGYKGLGIFWTWDYSSARCIWGDYSAGKKDVVLTGLVDLEAIDIKETVLANFHPSFGSIEQEITLKKGSFVTVVELSERTLDGPYSTKRFEPQLELTA